MLLRWFSCLTFVALLAFQAQTLAGDKGKAATPPTGITLSSVLDGIAGALTMFGDEDKAATPPTGILRVRSLDGVLDAIKVVADLGGKKDVGQQLEGLIKSKVGAKGLEGLDLKRPVGAYLRLNRVFTVIAPIVMIPVADEKAFLGLFETLNQKIKKKDDGVYLIEQDLIPLDVGFRFANKYAYLTAQNLDALHPERLLTPAQAFPKSATGLISGNIHFDQKAFRNLAKAVLEDEIIKAKQKDEVNQTPAQKKLRQQMLDAFLKQAASLIDDGVAVGGSIDIDTKAREFVIETHLDARKNSKLAKTISELGQARSAFANLSGKGALASGSLRFSLPTELRKALNAVLDVSKEAALDKEKNPDRRKVAEAFLKAVEPTIRSGELDAGMILVQHGKTASVVLGLGVSEGEALLTTLRDLLKNLPRTETDKIKLDVSEVAGVSIHRIEANLDPKSKAFFGEEAAAYLAIGKNVAMLSIGEGGLNAIKSALEQKGAAVPLMQLELSLGRFLQMVSKDADKELLAKVVTNEDDGRIRLSLEGGTSLRFTGRASFAVVRLLVLVSQQKKPAAEDGN